MTKRRGVSLPVWRISFVCVRLCCHLSLIRPFDCRSPLNNFVSVGLGAAVKAEKRRQSQMADAGVSSLTAENLASLQQLHLGDGAGNGNKGNNNNSSSGGNGRRVSNLQGGLGGLEHYSKTKSGLNNSRRQSSRKSMAPGGGSGSGRGGLASVAGSTRRSMRVTKTAEEEQDEEEKLRQYFSAQHAQ